MPKPSEYDKTHRRNMAAIGTRIDRIFKKAAEEAAKIGINIKSPLPEDRIFSFDDYPETQKQIDRLMAALKESMETAITSGVRSGWTLANNKNNALCDRVFGDRVGNLTKEQYKRYYSNNEDALQAFLQRQTKGLNLSDRVWKYTQGFKREIELGLDLGLRSGTPAAKMARDLKQYLQHPDKLFRRVRDQHGILRLSQAAREFHPGQGVYRSSYRNARRLAVTETNMAYHTADYIRWQQLDFVVGIEIKVSGNHTIENDRGQAIHFTDICDTLAGRYPKDFKFVGWHPHCRCQAISILKTEEEMEQDTQRILDGQEPKKGSVNEIKTLPATFTDWVEEHSERIEMGANLPYFVRDNRQMVDKVLGIASEPKKTPLEIAEERHAGRKPEEIAKLQEAWNARRIDNLTQSIADGYLPKEVEDALKQIRELNESGHFIEANARIEFYQARAKKHMERTPKEIQDIKDAWKQRADKAKLVANNVLKVAQDYAEVDYSRLQALIAKGDAGAMRIEAQKVAKAVKTMRDRENALADLIPNVHEWHKTFSIAELEATKTNVLRTFAKKGWGMDINNATELDTLKRGLKHEVDWMGTKGKARYATWEVAQSAYQEKLSWAEKRIEMLAQKTAIEDEMKLLRASRSTVGKQLVADFDKMFKSDETDITMLRLKAADIKAKAEQLEKTRAKVAAKAATSSSTMSIPFGGMTDEEAKKALVDFAHKIGTAIDPASIVVENGYIHLQGNQHLYLYNALKVETPSEHKQLWTHNGGGGAHFGKGGYVRTGNSFQINKAFRQNGIFGEIDATKEALLRKAGMTSDDLKTIRLLDKKIDELSLPVPILATRYVGLEALESIFGTRVTAMGTGATDASLKAWARAVKNIPRKDMSVDPAFLSASTNEWQNVFYYQHKVKLQIEVPPGTPMYLTDNYPESEIVLSRGTQLEFIGVEVKEMVGQWGNNYKHVTIRCRVKR